MQLLREQQTPPAKILSLFNHPNFESKIEPEESPIIHLTPTKLVELHATRIIKHWFSLPLPKVRPDRFDTVCENVVGDLVGIMKGDHPKIRTKLSFEQIIKCVNNFNIARNDENYWPLDKTKLKKIGLERFMYNKHQNTSYLTIYLDPPKTLTKDINPQLTKLLMNGFAKAQWGSTAKDIEHEHRFWFILASNRLVKYLEEHQNEFQPMMGLSPQRPEKAAEALITVAAKSGNWNTFKPKWLSNQYSINNLDLWLRSNGFFKQSTFRHVL